MVEHLPLKEMVPSSSLGRLTNLNLNMDNPIETQLGGKYSPDNTKLFALKSALQEQGIGVAFPAGDSIIHEGDFALTDEAERDLPWHSTEFSFLRAVRDNPVHIIANTAKDNEGYLGGSASAELAYAMLKGKPAILLHRPVISERVPQRLRTVIMQHAGEFDVEDISLLSGEQLKSRIENAASREVDYKLTPDEDRIIREELRELLHSIRDEWKASQQK